MSVDEDKIQVLVESMKKRLEELENYLGKSGDQSSWTKTCKSTMESCLSHLTEFLPTSEGQALDVPRLEKVSRCCGLRFDCDLSGNTSTSCYISCDNFFLEVELSSDGMVGEVKLGHGDVAPQPQPKLQTLLRTGRYMAFCRHLRGLIAIYDLPGPKEDRATVYSALCSIEKDLLAYSNSIRTHTATSDIVMRHPLGAVQARECGRLMRTTFFIPPTSTTDVDNRRVADLGDVGVSGCVALATTLGNHTLSSKPVHQVNENTHDVTFGAIDSSSSVNVPCTFVLLLSESIAAPSSVAHEVLEATKMQDTGLTPSGLLHSVLHREVVGQPVVSQGSSQDSLQRHDVVVPTAGVLAFFVGVDKNQPSSTENAIRLQEIHFTQPQQLVNVIKLLRRQLVYNVLIKSCFVPSNASIHSFSSVQIIDVEGNGVSSIRVTFEHPVTRNLLCALVSVELDGIVSAKLQVADGDPCTCTDDVASRVMSRCLSLPVLVYSVRKRLTPTDE